MLGAIEGDLRSRAKSFTIVEVMIVIAIVGILAAIAYPGTRSICKKPVGRIPNAP
jgi:prepilin-type N-terminal cleavage/methylation domain-containing protein